MARLYQFYTETSCLTNGCCSVLIYFFQVMCIPLFYIQRLCAAIRLSFDVTVTYSLPRLSLSYPVELTVRIGQTVTTNATISGHASTWFHENGFYTKGNGQDFTSDRALYS